MSKLIGTNPNQVPSNADLGTAAFMDKKEFLLSKGSEMSAINAVIPKTAVDVFIYDTTKDSDGGAWRKRTRHTSWYNEKLNTTTRGSRKEFPVVAVIVVESAYVTIYDGDDPALPMWMGFTNASYAGHLWENAPSCVHALNAKIAVGSTPYDLNVVDFIADKAVSYSNNSVISGTHKFPISGRAPATGSYSSPADVWEYNTGVGNIVNRYVNDVAMTVLPNAPIDSVTGLPVPTIAVATNGGVSVIKDDGTIHNLTGGAIETISINDRQEFITTPTNSSDTMLIKPLNTTDANLDWNTGLRGYSWNPATGLYPFLSFRQANTVVTPEGFNFSRNAGVGGMTLMSEDFTNARKSLQAIISSDFNTGYQVGDIKLATLSDTDTTNAVGTELLANNLTANVTGWASPGGTIVWNASGYADVTRGASDGPYVASYPLGTTLTIGEVYTVTANIVTNNGGGNSLVRFGPSTVYSQDTDIKTGTGILSATFTATAAHTHMWLYSLPSNTTSFKEVYVRKAEEDRSVNGNGLQVFGTVTKSAVATGADLVGYSGFSSSNYLEQPYNSDLDFGTGDFSFMVWVKPDSTSSGRYVFQLNNSDGSKYIHFLAQHSGASLFNATGTAYISNGTQAPAGVWSCHCGVRIGNILELYLNGNLVSSVVSTVGDVADGTSTLTIGNRDSKNSAGAFNGNLALFRISATAPTPEQIKKIYEDEKFLFQENAKATLYGTSGAVTALAYDDDTNTLHAGTSAGRSDFQGLRRINNTTRAIGTAISAVDGFIVEE